MCFTVINKRAAAVVAGLTTNPEDVAAEGPDSEGLECVTSWTPD